jgi:hypothetical protein
MAEANNPLITFTLPLDKVNQLITALEDHKIGTHIETYLMLRGVTIETLKQLAAKEASTPAQQAMPAVDTQPESLA